MSWLSFSDRGGFPYDRLAIPAKLAQMTSYRRPTSYPKLAYPGPDWTKCSHSRTTWKPRSQYIGTLRFTNLGRRTHGHLQDGESSWNDTQWLTRWDCGQVGTRRKPFVSFSLSVSSAGGSDEMLACRRLVECAFPALGHVCWPIPKLLKLVCRHICFQYHLCNRHLRCLLRLRSPLQPYWRSSRTYVWGIAVFQRNCPWVRPTGVSGDLRSKTGTHI